ncbi:MAG: helix-turn-helix domain-containing protein [Phycisphaerae bacterium]
MRFPSGFRVPLHDHPWPQLVYAAHGVLAVTADANTWVVPSRRAVWVPARTAHTLESTGVTALRTVYLRPDLPVLLPDQCRVIEVTKLLRELIEEVIRLQMLIETEPRDVRLAAVLVDQITITDAMPLRLPMPHDPRAIRAAQWLLARPASADNIDEFASGSGASRRTLERLFQRETGMTIGRWRQQARLMAALKRLADGMSVTATALDVGYESASAFITMFKRTLGTTPRQYFESGN